MLLQSWEGNVELMGVIVLDSIPFKVDTDLLFERIHMDKDDEYAEQVMRLVEEANRIARPKVLYMESAVNEKGDDYVIVDGVRFDSRILRVNLDSVYRVFPYICTCGIEIEQWAESLEDVLERFWADEIMKMALNEACKAFEAHLEDTFHPGPTSSMNPGSLEDWPIRQQKQLFSLLGDPKGYIGVELTESYLMVPMKSTSGIRFSTETSYENCQLCSRENCPGRRAPYDPTLYDKKYKKVE